MKKFNQNIVNSLMIIALLMFVGGGCQQVNDMVNGNTASNGNTAMNSNATTNINTAPNSNTSANTDSTSNSNSETANSNTAVSKPNAIEGDKIEIPSDEKMQAMVREAILDFNGAVQAEDFTDFRAKVSKPFQATPVAKFNTAFGDFFKTKDQMQKYADSIKDMDAEFTVAPNLTKKSGYDVLGVSGSYATSPRNLRFELFFIPEGKEWKIIQISVNTK